MKCFFFWGVGGGGVGRVEVDFGFHQGVQTFKFENIRTVGLIS